MKEFIDFTDEVKQMVLKITMKIFYGYDYFQRVNIANYKTKQGYLDYIHFMDLFPKVLNDLDEEENSIKRFLLSYPAKKWLIEPYLTNFHNVTELWRILNDFVENTDDENSTYRAVMNSGEVDKNLLFSDFLSFVISSYITLPYAIWNFMLLMKKHPEVLLKVRTELIQAEINFRDLKDKDDFKLKLDTWDYFNWVLKEWLRINPSADKTMYYSTKEDIEFCNFKIYAGTNVWVNILERHFDPEQWIDPYEFIPERFNPMSEYFCRPDKEISRDNHAYIPFSFGIRGCTGQSFSFNFLKLVVAKLLLSIEYEVDQFQLEGKSSGFVCNENKHLRIKITEKIKIILSNDS